MVVSLTAINEIEMVGEELVMGGAGSSFPQDLL